MASKGVVRDTDKGFKVFFKGLGDLDGMTVKVGIQGREAAQIRPGGISMVELGTIHEFGAPQANIPQRSFIRATADANRRKYERALEKIVETPDRARSGLFRLGEVVRADIIQRIKDRIPPPLQPATVRRKRGESVPLIDTGQLINSIRAVVT